MTVVPLGQNAYRRLAGGNYEVVLQNRYVETAPQNLREHTLLLSRAATAQIEVFPNPTYGLGPMRAQYYFGGLFSDSLFVVCGNVLYRVNQDMSITTISGVISGTGTPRFAWMKGAGYEYLFVTDGLVLQFYAGTTGATGTLTLTGAVVPGTDKFQIGGVYYGFGTTFSGSDVGTSAHPYIVNPTSAAGHVDPLNQVQLAISAGGTPGVDYSATITGPNTLVTATTPNIYPPAVTTCKFTAITVGTGGNSISTTVVGGTALSFGAATLSGGGIDALQGVTVPNGATVSTLTQVSGYVLVAINKSQTFYWLNPGAVVINALNFASKESSPDPIQDMVTTGDNALIMGEASTENWYATGQLAAPFAPIEGRVYQRGVIQGSPCGVDDSVCFVGDDGVAYSVGYQFGTRAQWGVHRISTYGIEERIRRQIRREAGLTP